MNVKICFNNIGNLHPLLSSFDAIDLGNRFISTITLSLVIMNLPLNQ